MKNYLVICILFLWTVFFAKAQTPSDSLVHDAEQDSIVYIDEEPVIIKKTVVEEEVIYNNWYIELAGGAFQHTNRHYICEEYIDYKLQMSKYFKPRLGNLLELNLIYRPNKSNIVFTAGVSTTNVKEIYTRDSSNLSGKNKYKYFDFRVGAGYWINRKKQVAALVSVSMITSRLLHKEGVALDYVDPKKEYLLSEVNREANWLLSGKVGAMVVFLNNKRMKFFIEPYSQVNFSSTLYYKEHYYQRRWSNGLNIGTIFVL